MKKTKSLRHRIARSFVLLALIVSGFFSLVAYFSVEIIEAQLIDAHLERIEKSVSLQLQRHEIPENTPDLDIYIGKDIPGWLQHLPSGLHDVDHGPNELRVLVHNDGDNSFVLVDNVSDFEHTEFLSFSSLGVGFVASLLLGMLLGWATARHIVAPVIDLADAVARHDKQEPLPSLDAQDEIGVLARAFARRTGELQQFLMRERLFTGDVSHELRTPLTIMLGAAEVLKTRLTDRPAELAVAERVRRVAAETSERVAALLMLSRAPETLDQPLIALAPLIRVELERCQPLLQGKPVQCRLHADDTVMVRARPELAGIVVGNLLRNACQYVDSGDIEILLNATSLSIEDRGPGLPPAVLEKLFERFVHGNLETLSTHTGTGLGLSIVKRVADHLGWDIRFDAPDGGSRFVISFPAASEPRDIATTDA